MPWVLVAQYLLPSFPRDSSRATLMSRTHRTRPFALSYSLYGIIVASAQFSRLGDISKKEGYLPGSLVCDRQLIVSQ